MELTPEMVQLLVQGMLGQYMWLIIVIFVGILFRKYIESMIDGIMVFYGGDIDENDIVWINGRMGRVQKHGFFKTVVYMADTQAIMVIPNSRLKTLQIEKHLPNNNFANIKKKLEQNGPEK